MGALSFLSTGFAHFSNMGVSQGLPDIRKAKRIILSNQISISIALFNLPYILIYPLMGKNKLGWMEVFLFLCYASIHQLNAKGFTTFSRLFLVLLANFDILTYTLILGTATGMHFLFMLAAWAPLLLFDSENRKALYLSIALSSTFFLCCELFAPLHGFDPLAPSSERTLFLITLLTTLGVQILFALYFFVANRRTEAALSASSEEAKAADRAKGIFLANLREEIHGPLQALFIAEKSLKELALPLESMEPLADIHASTLDLSHIVDEVMQDSILDGKEYPLTLAHFSLLQLSDSILRPFEFEAANRGISIVLERQPGLPEFIHGDCHRLRQVLRNLLGNALKFTDSGKITLRIALSAPGRLQFEIEDTGIGIPQALRHQIFEPFFQASGAITRKHSGTGLGLFISKQMIEHMGGSIHYRPNKNQGSLFSFSLPIHVDTPAQGALLKPSA